MGKEIHLSEYRYIQHSICLCKKLPMIIYLEIGRLVRLVGSKVTCERSLGGLGLAFLGLLEALMKISSFRDTLTMIMFSGDMSVSLVED